MEKTKQSALSKIPQVDQILGSSEIHTLVQEAGRDLVLSETQTLLSRYRADYVSGALSAEELEKRLDELEPEIVRRVLQRLSPSLRAVVNATGVILHTNLGRALLSEDALRALQQMGGSYNNLEYDLPSGQRGSRHQHAEQVLKELLGCEAAAVVNNNAAAVFLILHTLARGRQVIVSRGELVEIGGSFRIPDIMASSGGLLREVGTTNKTRVGDYAAAISTETALLLRVHPSNYRMIGFTERPSLEDLVRLGAEHRIPVVEDLGSGCLVDLQPYGIPDEPLVQDSLAAGVDLACFSGDKLLGGPQAGIIVGKAALVSRIRKNPLMRTLRVDKLTYSALEATLRSYLRGSAWQDIPVLRMISATAGEIHQRAGRLVQELASLEPAFSFELSPGRSTIGGGSAPAVELETALISVRSARYSTSTLEERLRSFSPPIIARVEENRLLLDLRTILPNQEADLQRAFTSLAAPG